MITAVEKCLFNLIDMLEILGFQNKSEVAPVDVRALVCAFVMNGNNISAQTGYYAGNALKLTGLVDKFKIKGAGASGHEQTSFDDAGENGNVDIAA